MKMTAETGEEAFRAFVLQDRKRMKKVLYKAVNL